MEPKLQQWTCCKASYILLQCVLLFGFAGVGVWCTCTTSWNHMHYLQLKAHQDSSKNRLRFGVIMHCFIFCTEIKKIIPVTGFKGRILFIFRAAAQVVSCVHMNDAKRSKSNINDKDQRVYFGPVRRERSSGDSLVLPWYTSDWQLGCIFWQLYSMYLFVFGNKLKANKGEKGWGITRCDFLNRRCASAGLVPKCLESADAFSFCCKYRPCLCMQDVSFPASGCSYLLVFNIFYIIAGM